MPAGSSHRPFNHLRISFPQTGPTGSSTEIVRGHSYRKQELSWRRIRIILRLSRIAARMAKAPGSACKTSPNDRAAQKLPYGINSAKLISRSARNSMVNLILPRQFPQRKCQDLEEYADELLLGCDWILPPAWLVHPRATLFVDTQPDLLVHRSVHCQELQETSRLQCQQKGKGFPQVMVRHNDDHQDGQEING